VRRSPLVTGATILTLGIVSVVPAIRAADPWNVEANDKTIGEVFAPDAGVSLRLPFRNGENLSYGAVTESPSGEPSASELNRQLTNPVSSIWSIANQFNNFELNNGHWNNNWNFQPVLPLSLTKDWNLITRPVMPFYNIVPHETALGQFERAACRCPSRLLFRSLSRVSCFNDAESQRYGPNWDVIFNFTLSCLTGRHRETLENTGLTK
jgi:hypothetical protein